MAYAISVTVSSLDDARAVEAALSAMGHSAAVRAIKGRAVQPSAPVDKASLSDEELRAHYAKIAPVENVRAFSERTSASTPAAMAIQQRAAVLLSTLEANGGKHTTATKQEYSNLLAEWRRARIDAEHAARPKMTRAERADRDRNMTIIRRDHDHDYGVHTSRGACSVIRGAAEGFRMGWPNCIVRTVAREATAAA